MTFRAGDFLLVKSSAKWYTRSGFLDACIRLGDKMKMRREGTYTPFADQWSHAVCISEGSLIEALGHGVVRSPYSKYTEYLYVDSKLTDEQRELFVQTAEANVGMKYGFLTIASLALTMLTGTKIRFNRSGEVICSGLVAACLGLPKWRTDPSFVTPSDLALLK